MTKDMQKKYKSLSRDKRKAIKDKFAFRGDDTRFIAYIRQEGLGMEVMWMILDPTNPVDPRFLC